MSAAMSNFLKRSISKTSSVLKVNPLMTVTSRKHHDLSGKVALVTGSSEGIGFAIARRLGQDGAKVVINSRKQEKVDHAVEILKNEKIDVIGVAGHVGKTEDRGQIVQKVVERLGGIDILVNNAGTSPYVGASIETPESMFDKLFETNVKSGFFMSQECVPHMAKRGGGNIVFVSSVTAYQPFNVIGVYSITKLTLLGIVRVLSTELAEKNIRVNAVAPGLIDTKFSDSLRSDDVRDQVLEKIPMKRFGSTEDCAGSVAFLVSDDARYITGETLSINGGMQSRL